MRRLGRKTLYTQDNALEIRIEQLERRIFPQATVWAWARLTTPQTITAGSSEHLAFDDFWTGNNTIFYTTNNTAGDAQILSNEFGVFIANSSVEWEDIGSTYPHSHRIDITRQIVTTFGTFGAGAPTASEDIYPAGVGTAVLDTGDASIGVHSPWDYLSTQPAGWQLLVSNGAGVDADVTRASIFVALLPSAEKEQDYVVF